MKPNIKAIFCDIDWTLLNHKPRKWDIRSIKGLIKAQKKGIKVFLATARPYDSVKNLGIFDLFTPDGVICTNGAVAIYNNEVINEVCIPQKELDNIFDIAKKYNITVLYALAKDRYFTKEKDNYVEEYFKVFFETYPSIREPKKGDKVSAILMYANKSLDGIYDKELLPSIHPYRFNDNGVDVTVNPINKSIGINYMLNYLNISKDNAMGIGDDYGDIPMFESVKYSIAMKNGKKDAKDKAMYITRSVKHHGVLKALRHFKVVL